MPNPGISTSDRAAIYLRAGEIQRLWLALKALELFFHPTTNRVEASLSHGDEANTALENFGLRCTRAVIGTDTDANGYAYLTITDGGSGTGHTGTFYNDQARTTAVATFAATDDNNTATITPNSGFTLAGFLDLGAITANTDVSWKIAPPPAQRAPDVFDGTQEEDSSIRDAHLSAVATARRLLGQAAAAFESVGGLFLRTTVRRHMIAATRGNTIFDAGVNRGNAGEITEVPLGLLQDWLENSAGNTAVISVLDQTDSGTVTFPGSFTGRASAVTLTDLARAGTVFLICRKGLDSSAPTFSGSINNDDTRLDDATRDSVEFELTIGQVFISQRLGIASVTIDYAPTITNDGGEDSLDTTSTLWSVSGLTSDLSTSGTLYTDYQSGVLYFYATTDDRTAGDTTAAVCSATVGASTAFQATGSFGITVNGTTGATPADDDQGSVAFNPPVAGSSHSIQIAISVTREPSAWQKAARNGAWGGARYRLHSVASGETIPESTLTAAVPGGRARHSWP